MPHLMACGDAPSCKWTDLAIPNLAGVNCDKHWEVSNSNDRGLGEEEEAEKRYVKTEQHR